MKTLKITEQTHKELTELQARIYKINGVKLTFNEIIMGILTAREKYENGN